MAQAAVSVQSTLTDRFQTTVPATVRQALHLEKRDKLNFTVLGDGTVIVSKAEEQDADPVIASFLTFLERDIKNNPQHIQPLSAQTRAKADALVADVDIDLDSPLSDEDE